MHEQVYPVSNPELPRHRHELAPEVDRAFHEFSRAAFAEGVLSRKVKQLIAVAVAHMTQCPYCIRSHTHGALCEGATEREIVEAMWIAAEMRASAAFAHAAGGMETRVDEARRP
jgi:AhpD family alkylhydroperoxidase